MYCSSRMDYHNRHKNWAFTLLNRMKSRLPRMIMVYKKELITSSTTCYGMVRVIHHLQMLQKLLLLIIRWLQQVQSKMTHCQRSHQFSLGGTMCFSPRSECLDMNCGWILDLMASSLKPSMVRISQALWTSMQLICRLDERTNSRCELSTSMVKAPTRVR